MIFFISSGLMLFHWYEEKQAQKQFEELAGQTQDVEDDSVNEESKGETEQTEESGKTDFEALGIKIPEKNLDWDALHEENAHIYAWIYIPNTDIDYPVVQHPDDADYYLRRDLSGKSSTPGCIFTEFYNDKDFTDLNTVIYGHNMRNGTMFATLHNYENLGFFEENPYVYIYRPEGVLVYEVFTAYVGGDQHLLFSYDSTTPQSFQSYLDAVYSIRDMGAHFREGVEVTGEDHIISLSTCVRGQANNRYLVQAVLLNTEALQAE
ncbi:MAG: class B sortase [Peptococcaceae bacterium]|nr:class B sortase [Peptococcaceae bacterium]